MAAARGAAVVEMRRWAPWARRVAPPELAAKWAGGAERSALDKARQPEGPWTLEMRTASGQMSAPVAGEQQPMPKKIQMSEEKRKSSSTDNSGLPVAFYSTKDKINDKASKKRE